MNNSKAAKLVKIIIIAVGAVAVMAVGLFLWAVFSDDTPDNPDDPIVTPVIQNNLNITVVNNVIVEDPNKVIYDDKDLKLTIEPATEEEIKKSSESGTTRDGKTWKSSGNQIVVDNKKVTVNENKKNKDNGKIAAVVTALSSNKGYTRGVDDYNHNYAVYYMEVPKCMLYYPKQLTLVKEGEDQSLLFRDTRSNAELKVTISENKFASMDEVESLIANSDYNQVLASGTDWYSAEKYGKSTTTFTLNGLGNKYAVKAELTYEKKYSFVFEELRALLKCKFIEGGIWVSNAGANTAGRQVPAVAKSAGAYDPVLKRTSYYSKELKCVIAYPDIFSKVYTEDSTVYFTDPATGALIELGRQDDNGWTIGDIQAAFAAEGADSDLVSDHSLRAQNKEGIYFVTIRDGYMWSASMTYMPEYEGIYSYAYSMFEICVEGDDVNTTEMQEIYFPAFNCYVVMPVQYEEYGTDGDIHLIRDAFTGMEARLSFTEVKDPADYDNLYNMFHVVAEDDDLLLGEDYVKWHNQSGLFLGAVGREYAAMLELSYPNAYEVYKSCWKDFGIAFYTGEEFISDAEEIRDEAKAAIVLEAAKEEIINGDNQTADVFGKADKNTKKDSNTAKKLEDNGKEQVKKESRTEESKSEPNRVLVYKTETDYLDVITTGYEWMYEYPNSFPRPADTRKARYYTVLYTMNVLAYNGYTIPGYAADVYKVADIVDEYVNFLMNDDQRIDSDLGEGVVSVFEVLCYYLGIEEVPRYVLPDYKGNEVEPTAAPTKAPDATPTPVPTGVPAATPTPTPVVIADVSKPEPSDAKKTFEVLPFDEIPYLDEETAIYGSITSLEYERNDTVYAMMLDAIDILLDMNFVCEDKDISEWGEYYYLRGFLPGTDMEMLMVIDIESYGITVNWMLEDYDYFFDGGSLTYYNVEYSYRYISHLDIVIHYFVNDVNLFEDKYNSSLAYRYTTCEYDMTEQGFDKWAQSEIYDYDDTLRTLDVIEAGYYENGEFYMMRTYVYLEVEGITLFINNYGNVESLYY